MKDQSLNDRKLRFEFISNSTQRNSSTSVSTLNQVWDWFVELVLRSDELKIHTLQNKSGETFWRVHDRHAGRSLYFGSETEVRAWLDRRFYQ